MGREVMKRKGAFIVLFAVLLVLSSVAIIACGNKSDGGGIHTVTFVGTRDAVVAVNDGDYITLPEPSRDGYKFAGWFTDCTFTDRYYGDEPIKTNLNLYPYWQDGETAQYAIRFHTSRLVAVKVVEMGGTFAYSQFPTLARRDGCVAYWSLNGNVVDGDIICVDRNMDVYAAYESEDAVNVVMFDSRGGSAVVPQIVKTNEKVNPVEPSKDGLYFAGWYTDEDCTKEYDFNSVVFDNITLYAKWTEAEVAPANGTIVTFDVPKIIGDFNGWNYSVSQKYSVIGGRASILFNPLCDSRILVVFSKVYVEGSGWTFNEAYNLSGERAKSDLSNASRVEKNKSAGDYYIAVIKAHGKSFELGRYCDGEYVSHYDVDGGVAQINNIHRVRFETNGGSTVDMQFIADGEKATVPENPTCLGKIFIAWTNRSGMIVRDVATEKITADTVFYAKWEDGYIVTFDTNGGTAIDARTVAKTSDESGALIIEPMSPTKDGYNFDGWYTDCGFDTPFEFEVMTIKGDVTLVAKWGEISFGDVKTVTFDYQGGTVDVDQSRMVEVYCGRTVSPLLHSPKKSGCYLIGWYKDKRCNVPFDFDEPIYSDVTLYAGYANIPNGYYAVYYDCSPRLPRVVHVGDKAHTYAISVDTIEREGYDFAGWYNDINYGNRAEDWPTGGDGEVVTIYANWTTASTVNFTYYDYNGNIFATEQRAVGRVIARGELFSPDERAGYTFDGWCTDSALTRRFPDSMTVMSNVNLYSSWAQAPKTRIVFHDMNGVVLAEGSIARGAHGKRDFIALCDTAREGYVFNQWFLDSSRTCALPDNYKVDGADINLYGSWVRKGATPSGSGTSNSPYLVSNYEQFAAHLLMGNNVVGTHYRFTADVRLIAGNELISELYATVDFNGYSVGGVTRPLFDKVMTGAKIVGANLAVDIRVMNNRDVNAGAVCNVLYGTVELVWINGTVYLPDISYVGGVAGRLGSSGALIKNCLNSAAVTGKDFVGGIVGTALPVSSARVSGKIMYCVNEGIIVASASTYDEFACKNGKHGSGVVGECCADNVIGCVTTTRGDNPDISVNLPVCGYNKGGATFSPYGTPDTPLNGNTGVTNNSVEALLNNWLNYKKGVSDTSYIDEFGVMQNCDEGGGNVFTNNEGMWYYDEDGGFFRLTKFNQR